jgi:uncharacterized membrane protein YjjB (DUF3815 family)
VTFSRFLAMLAVMFPVVPGLCAMAFALYVTEPRTPWVNRVILMLVGISCFIASGFVLWQVSIRLPKRPMISTPAVGTIDRREGENETTI